MFIVFLMRFVTFCTTHTSPKRKGQKMDISLTLTPQKTYAFPSLGLISAHKPTSLKRYAWSQYLG
jgi:hypothetical protein